MTFPDQIRQHFNRHAAHYDNPVTAYIGVRELRSIQKHVPDGSTVLDYGCGTGRTTLDLLRRGCQVTAYDLSDQMIGIAEAQSSRLGFQAEFTTDISKLTGRIWPVVTCIGVWDYYADPAPLLRQLGDYLSQESRLVMTVPNVYSPLGWLYALGSRARMPVTPRTPGFVVQAARGCNLQVSHLSYAFPALRPFGLTLVIEMRRG